MCGITEGDLMNLMGIDIGGTKTAVCVGTATGEIKASKRMGSSQATVELYRKELIELCHSVLEKAGVPAGKVDAIGISAPGPLDCARGVLIAPPNNPGWHDVPVKAMIERSFSAPVHVNNDANACALAEMLFGEYRGCKNLIYLTFSTGMGGGIIVNGQLVQGANDTGGEVGHMVMDPDGPLCGCGHRGCWETYVGGRMVAEQVRAKIRAGGIQTSIIEKAGSIDAINMQALEAAAREGDRFALAEWDALTDRVAQGIGVLVMALNPDVVVLGTIGIHAGEFVMAPIRDKLSKYAWKWPLEHCKVVASSLGGKIGDFAALAVAVEGGRRG